MGPKFCSMNYSSKADEYDKQMHEGLFGVGGEADDDQVPGFPPARRQIGQP
jgi:hypothetical protein